MKRGSELCNCDRTHNLPKTAVHQAGNRLYSKYLSWISKWNSILGRNQNKLKPT